MISEKMSKLLERSAAMSSMYTESADKREKLNERLAGKCGREIDGIDSAFGDRSKSQPAAPDSIRENEYPRFAGNRPLVSASLYAE